MRNDRRAGWVAALVLLGVCSYSFTAPQRDEQVLDRLHSLGQAIHMYASENKGFLPPDLGLLKKYLGEQAVTAQDAFVYAVRPGTKINSKRSATAQWPLVLWQDPAGALYVLYADGHTQAFAPVNAERPLPAVGAAPASQPAAQPAPNPAAPALMDLPTAGPVPTTVMPDPSKAILGAWAVNVDPFIATYQFNPDATFTLTFTPAPRSAWRGPGSGRAGGKWILENNSLVMTNAASETPFTVVGEKEDAQVVGLDAGTLVLKTTDAKGRDEQCILRRVIPFEKGKRDNDLIVGTWKGNSGITLVLADSGLAVLEPVKGEWSQHGLRLTLQLTPSSLNPGVRPRQPGAESGFKRDLTVDLVSESTLVVTGNLALGNGREQVMTYTLLRVK